jgi:phytoene dehydrogenase-like protein
MKTYDAVIIGGGHNGLVAACYLARAGFDVCVLERYHTVGGAAISEEIDGAPGYIASTGSYVLSLAPRKILDELDVWEHGVELIKRNPRSFSPLGDGESFMFWEDEAELLREIARFSKRDAEAYPVYDAMVERACQIMDRFILGPPPSFAEFAAAFDRPGDEKVFKMMILGSVADVAEYFFESDIMQGSTCALGLIGTFRGPREPGTAYVKLYHTMGMSTGSRGAWAYVRGAMGSVTQALASVARIEGVEIRTGVEVERVLIDDGRALGIVTLDGEEIRSRTVLSNADPKRTYLKLVGAEQLPDEYARDIAAIQIESPVMKINLALSELPRYRVLGGDRPYEWGQNGGVHIAPSIDYLQTAYEDARAGQPSDYPFFSIHAQSAVDPSLAPEGGQTLSIFTQFFPYELAEGTWDERRDEIADHVISRYAEHAPNVAGAIIARQVLAPPDIEARFGLTGGHIFQGELVPEQAFDLRPVPGSKTYEGPIRGLYLCGSGAWPGGCVMGAPGHNAAQEAIAKLKSGRHD